MKNKVIQNKIAAAKNDPAVDKTVPSFETNLVRAFITVTPFLIVLISYYCIIALDKTNVGKYPYLYFICLAVSFGYLASNLTLAFLVKKSIARFSVVCIPPVIYLVNLLIGSPIPGVYCLFVCLVVACSVYINYVLSVCDDICNALDINVFSLKNKKQ